MEKEFEKFVKNILRYIKRQNFNGADYYLKKNILNYIKEKKEIEISKQSKNNNHPDGCYWKVKPNKNQSQDYVVYLYLHGLINEREKDMLMIRISEILVL